MNVERHSDSIFCGAIEIECPAERAAYLDNACGDDRQLRQRVDQLVEAHERANRFLADETETDAQDSMSESTMIGPYKLRERLGAGGMGVVWAAEQLRPVQRKVALKVIKPGMDSEVVIARFEAERQALALMDHPHIARVLDAGTTEQGRPYFVMELIRGIPITEYCDANKLSIAERLELFGQICKAVQHAHQKGIIHRDIKPSNVLITLHDGVPVPKVIDFGVAKALNQKLTDKTIYTRVHQAIGTLAYMSPEQAELSGLDIDTRADVYGLGVLLYELLTGTTPFEQRRLNEAAYHEACRIIRDEEPPRPSTRLSSLGQTATAVSASRRSDPAKLGAMLRGELDWIVMKALEKDRTRRYETASSMAADVGRYLNHRPVEARSPSTWYRYRKFVQRNRLPVAAGVLLVLSFFVAFGALGRMLYLAQSLSDERMRFGLDMAVTEVVSGDKARASEAIERACQARVPDSWLETLRGLLALYGGEENAVAIAHLEKAVELDETNLASKSMLAAAYAVATGDDRYHDVMTDLEGHEPKNELEAVFRGQALLYQSTPAGLELLDRFVGPGSPPLFHAIRADALMHSWIETGDSEKGREAIRLLNATTTLLPDSTYIASVNLCAHSAAIQLSHELSLNHHQLCERAAELAATLNEHQGYPTTSAIRAHYYKAVGDYQAALQACRQAIAEGGVGYCRTQAAALEYQHGNYEVARDLLRPGNVERDPWILFGWAETLAFTKGSSEEIKDTYERLLEERLRSKFHVKYHIPEAILLQQDDGVYRKRKCSERLTLPDLAPWERAVVKYVADQLTDEEFLTFAESSRDKPRLNRGRAEKLVAMKALLNSDRERARKHFQACLDIIFIYPHAYWAQAHLTRLEADPSWPEWSQAKSKPAP